MMLMAFMLALCDATILLSVTYHVDRTFTSLDDQNEVQGDFFWSCDTTAINIKHHVMPLLLSMVSLHSLDKDNKMRYKMTF